MPQTTLVAGPFHPGLENALIEEVRRRKKADSLASIVIIVGSRALARRIERRLLDGITGLFNVRIVTLAELARLLNAAAIDATPEIPAGAELLLADVEREFPPGVGDDPFRGSSRFPGFTRSLAKTLGDLDEACIEELRPEWFGADSSRATKMLPRLLRIYRARAASFLTPSRKFAPPSDPSKAFQLAAGADNAIFYGFYDFNEAEWRFVQSLLKSIDAYFYLPYEASPASFSPPFAYAARLLNRLYAETVAEPLAISLNQPPLSASLFGTCYSPTPIKPGLSVIAPRHPLAETSRIAEIISGLVYSQDVAPEEIGVVLWDWKTYAGLLQGALRRAGIPCSVERGGSPAESPAAQAATGLLALSPTSLRRKELFDLLASGRVKLSGEDVSCADWMVGRLGRRIRIIRGGASEWSEAFQRLGERINFETGRDSGEEQSVCSRLSAFVARLIHSLGKFAGAGSAGAMVEAATELLAEFLVECEEKAPLLEICRNLSLSGRDDLHPTAVKFCAAFAAGIARVSSDAAAVEGVALLTPLGARGLRFRYLFVPGLAQGKVPNPAGNDPFLPDSVRSQLNRRLTGDDGRPLKILGDRTAEERLLFALLLDAAEDELILSYPQHHLDRATPLFPSRYLTEVCSLYEGRQVEAEELSRLNGERLGRSSEAPISSRKIDEGEYRMDIFRSIKDAAARRSLIEGVIGGNSEWFDRRRIRLEARLGVDRFTQFDGVVGAPSPVKEKPLFDVSGLESWASCPFRFFIERTLGLEEAEEPEIAFSPPASVAGTALHKGLEELYRRAAIERKFPLAREREWAASVIESAFARRRKRLREDWLAPDFAYAAAEGQWKQRILGALDDLDRLDSGYGDSGSKRLEWKFELALPEVDGASIRGKIDRLDFAPTGGIRVVDYKTGKVSSPDEFESGSRLQLPIYLTAALRETGAPEGESSASYFQIGPGGGIRVLSLGGGWLSANRDELFRFVKVITAGISGGFFPPLPLHDPSCSNCPAAKACDLPGRAAARRKLSDPAGEGLRSLREEE